MAAIGGPPQATRSGPTRPTPPFSALGPGGQSLHGDPEQRWSAINAGGLVFQNQAYTLNGDPLALTGPTPTVTVNAANATIGSAITGSAGLVKAGAGLLDISGINTYGGNTTITGGTLELPAGGTINNAGQIIVGGPGGATFNLSGGAVTTSNSGFALYVGQNSGQPGAVNISGGC